jgi:hypothetical protein
VSKEHIVARIRALWSSDEIGDAWDLFRRGLRKAIQKTNPNSDAFPASREMPADISRDAYKKAVVDLSEQETKKILELRRRFFESEVIKKEADAKLRQAEALKAQVELMDFVRSKRLTLYQDKQGNITVIPCASRPPGRTADRRSRRG